MSCLGGALDASRRLRDGRVGRIGNVCMGEQFMGERSRRLQLRGGESPRSDSAMVLEVGVGIWEHEGVGDED